MTGHEYVGVIEALGEGVEGLAPGQRVSGEVLLGRGVPREWLADGNEIEVRRYPINGGGRMGFSMKVTGSVIDIVLTGDRPCGEVLVELPCEGFEVRKEEKFNDGNER